MSTQAFSSVPPTPTTTPFTTKDTKEHEGENQLQKQNTPAPWRDPFEVRMDVPGATPLPDEPWRITIVRAEEQPQLEGWAGVEAGRKAALARLERVQRWRAGDLGRLKDDTPYGVMKYIATHTDGIWGQLAAKALRDAERLEKLARENVPYGQTWTVETDLDKLREMKEEREAQRTKEEAERAAFIERQHELLKKAGKAARCEYEYVDGRTCRAPQVKGERWCHGHRRMMSYRPGELALAPMEDENAVMLNLLQIQRALVTARITEKTAALLLYSVAIAAPCVARVRKPGVSRELTRKHAKINPPRRRGDAENCKEIRPQTSTDEHRRNSANHRGAQSRKISRELTRKNTNQAIGPHTSTDEHG